MAGGRLKIHRTKFNEERVMQKSEFVYVTYIRTTPEKLWQALTDPQITVQYFFGTKQESEWKPGASWRLIMSDGTLVDSGEVVEIDPPKKLVLKWRKEGEPEMHADEPGRRPFPAGQSRHDVVHRAEHDHRVERV